MGYERLTVIARDRANYSEIPILKRTKTCIRIDATESLRQSKEYGPRYATSLSIVPYLES